MTTLSRVYGHFQETDRAVGIISAFIKENIPEVNLRRSRALAADIKNTRYGFFYVDGFYIENKGTPEEKKVHEQSVFIIGRLKDSGNLKFKLKQWLLEYNQESAVYKPDGKNEVFLLLPDGSQQPLGVFHPNRIGDYMSRLKGRGERTFVFEKIIFGKTWMQRLTERTLTGKVDPENIS